MNILICSVGRHVQIVKYFKEEFNKVGGKVVAVGNEPTSPALYHADFHEIVPRVDHPSYISILKGICHKYEIQGIVTFIDPELQVLAELKKEFNDAGIQVFVSDKRVIDICNDKYVTYQFLVENNIPSVPTYVDFESVIEEVKNGKWKYPLIIKPKEGNASIGVQKISNRTELELYWHRKQNLIAQPFIEGDEYNVECYIDIINGKTTNLFSKRKINMRGGLTDKSRVIKDCELNELIEHLMERLKPTGPIDIDLFKTEEGYIISEINPRFGAGYPYAHRMGENFIESMINNLNGISNPSYTKYLGTYDEGNTLIRYDHFAIL